MFDFAYQIFLDPNSNIFDALNGTSLLFQKQFRQFAKNLIRDVRLLIQLNNLLQKAQNVSLYLSLKTENGVVDEFSENFKHVFGFLRETFVEGSHVFDTVKLLYPIWRSDLISDVLVDDLRTLSNFELF